MPLELNRSDVRIFTKESDYGFRDYSPAYARFMTEDPIRDGTNWFAYVGNNPVNWVDPWGLSASDGQDGNGNTNLILSGLTKIFSGTCKTAAGWGGGRFVCFRCTCSR